MNMSTDGKQLPIVHATDRLPDHRRHNPSGGADAEIRRLLREETDLRGS